MHKKSGSWGSDSLFLLLNKHLIVFPEKPRIRSVLPILPIESCVHWQTLDSSTFMLALALFFFFDVVVVTIYFLWSLLLLHFCFFWYVIVRAMIIPPPLISWVEKDKGFTDRVCCGFLEVGSWQ